MQIYALIVVAKSGFSGHARKAFHNLKAANA